MQIKKSGILLLAVTTMSSLLLLRSTTAKPCVAGPADFTPAPTQCCSHTAPQKSVVGHPLLPAYPIHIN
jgi:hypothetical protein